MTNVTGFPRPLEKPSAPADNGTVEAFVTMGACDTGLMFGHLAIQIPPGNDSEATFRKLVDHVFKGVPGFRFGIVIGRELLA